MNIDRNFDKSRFTQAIDTLYLREQLRIFDQTADENNVDRIRTVAARTFLIAEALDIRSIAQYANDMLAAINQVTEVAKVRDKESLDRLRRRILSVLAPTSAVRSKITRDRLHADALELGKFQEQRFIDATRPSKNI